jgi:hypothetical protein
VKIPLVLAAGLVTLVAAAQSFPAAAVSAVKPKPKPKPIHGQFAATATPDPTSDTPEPAGKGRCNPVTPTARATHAFTVPAAGRLTVQLNNKLDWSGDIRLADGSVETDTDGDLPTSPEAMSATFKRRTKVIIGACNFSGEPTVHVTYTFTYR